MGECFAYHILVAAGSTSSSDWMVFVVVRETCHFTVSTDVLRHCVHVCVRACVGACAMSAVVVVTIASVAVLVLHTQVSDCLCEWSN